MSRWIWIILATVALAVVNIVVFVSIAGAEIECIRGGVCVDVPSREAKAREAQQVDLENFARDVASCRAETGIPAALGGNGRVAIFANDAGKFAFYDCMARHGSPISYR